MSQAVTGQQGGIIWGVKEYPLTGEGARQAADYMIAWLSHVLWKGDPLTLQDGSPANGAKFNAPVVANGRVFVATFSNALNVCGLR